MEYSSRQFAFSSGHVHSRTASMPPIFRASIDIFKAGPNIDGMVQVFGINIDPPLSCKQTKKRAHCLKEVHRFSKVT